MKIHEQRWRDEVCYLIMEEYGTVQLEIYPEPLGPRQCRAYLHNLWVLPEHRGGGIATRLIRQAEKTAAGHGIDHVHLRTLEGEAEEWTKEWYARRGYKPIGFTRTGAEEWRKELKPKAAATQT